MSDSLSITPDPLFDNNRILEDSAKASKKRLTEIRLLWKLDLSGEINRPEGAIDWRFGRPKLETLANVASPARLSGSPLLCFDHDLHMLSIVCITSPLPGERS
jgi:hypothetical protein